MDKNRNSLDGFSLSRRPRGQSKFELTDASSKTEGNHQIIAVDPRLKKDKNLPLLRRDAGPAIGVGGLDLAEKKTKAEKIDIDMDMDDRPGRDKPVKVKKNKRRKKIIIISLIILALIGLGVAGYFAYKIFLTGSKIFKGNVVGAIFTQGKMLKEDENGRSNVLLFGTSEDDPGHPGGDLTDSIMIASVNQTNKDVFLVSVPRDLYVDYGRACVPGYSGKINALYSCVVDEGEDAAQAALRQKVGEVFGLDIQYSVHLNYTALREAVDAVGGITVVIDSEDPRGILDRNFDWDCPNGPQTCYNVKYPNGPVDLNGRQALFLARARGDDGRTYGLAQSNFDREKYQRKILIALKDKAVSAGTLANPVKVNSLLDALGDNIRTNFDAEEIKTLVSLGQKINSDHIVSLVLNDPDRPLVNTGNIGGQSVVKPSAGIGAYGDIQAMVDAYATGDVAVIEGSTVDVLNATGPDGAAQTKANELEAAKLVINLVGNAPESFGTKEVQFYDLTGGKKPLTRAKLESLLKVQVSEGVPEGVTSRADFVVIIGSSSSQQ